MASASWVVHYFRQCSAVFWVGSAATGAISSFNDLSITVTILLPNKIVQNGIA